MTFINDTLQLDRLETAISDLRAVVTTGFSSVNSRLDTLEVHQQETNKCLTSLEGTVKAHHNDIKELYFMVAGPQERTV
ncbi:MAG TPA: hypothetical protein VF401_03015 [Candidatus Saccharimonadales bacterium]